MRNTEMRLRAFLIGYLLVFFSMFIGQGYNPVFAVVALVSPSVSFASLVCYILFSLLSCISRWSAQGTGVSELAFQTIMVILGYLPLLGLPFIRKVFSTKSFFSGLGITIASATFYWWTSNFLCFTQMSGLIPSWKAYDFSFFGYLVCLFSGGTFYLHSLFVSVPAYVLLFLLGKSKAKTLRESLCYAR